MEKSKEKQLVNRVRRVYETQVERVCKTLIKNVDKKTKVDDVIEEVCQKLAFGIIIHAGKGYPSSFIGTYKQCTMLKDKFEGQIGTLGYNWYWIGFSIPKDIRKLVKNKQKDVLINVLGSDIADATLKIGLCTCDIQCVGVCVNYSIYVGNYKVCTLLHRKYGGIMNRRYNRWYWEGVASSDEINLVCETYRKKARRFKRKKIVLNL